MGVVFGTTEMHAPFQKFGGCDVLREGRDIADWGLGGGGGVEARGMLTGLGGGVCDGRSERCVWRVVRIGGGAEKGVDWSV